MTEPSHSTFQLIREAVASAHTTEHFTAAEVLARYPELRNNPSALIDLAYEEYCQARDRGDTIDQERFASQFPEVEKSLLELLEVHSFVVGNSLLSMEEPEAKWPGEGEEFLGFRLIEEIGRGAFARVFLANEIGLGDRRVVVKVSQKGAAEANVLGSLDHPNIVPIFALKRDEVVRLTALCMPYLGRTTAADWIETRFKSRGRLRVESRRHLRSVLDFGKGVCRGLEYAHQRQILHCDIKPSNILITHDGEPVLLDFNLSTEQSSEVHLVGGTLLYMAPEQLKRAGGDTSAKISPATDVFCLAATLYQMATGRAAFPLDPPEGARLKDLIQKSLDLRESFFDRAHDLPEPLLSTFKSALAIDPEKRIPTARAFYDRLQACENALVPKRWWLLPIAAGGLVALAVLVPPLFRDHQQQAPAPKPSIESEGEVQEDGPQEPLPAEEPWETQLKHARRLQKQGDYAEAVEEYRRLLERYGKTTTFDQATLLAIRESLAFCLLMNEELNQAQDVLDLLPLSEPGTALFQNRMALCLMRAFESENVPLSIRLKRISKARLKVRQAIQRDPHDPRLQFLEAVLEIQVYREHSERSLSTVTNLLKAARDLGISRDQLRSALNLLPELSDHEYFSDLKDKAGNPPGKLELDIQLQSPLTGQFRSREVEVE